MSVEVVTEARSMADFILKSAFRGPGDTVDAAMHRAERDYGAPAKWLHRLRYRADALRDLPASAFFQIQKAYRAAEASAERAYEREKALADERNSKIRGLAAAVAGPTKGAMK